jgi:hypothetical protein
MESPIIKEHSGLQHELDLGQKFGELIAEYKLVYGRKGDSRMVSHLNDIVDQLFKVQGSLEPELEFMEGILKTIIVKLKLYGWKDIDLHNVIKNMLDEVNKLHTSSQQDDNDIGNWSHPERIPISHFFFVTGS